MSESPERPADADTETPDEDAPAVNPVESREDRREERGKHTLILRELAIIAALLLAILAFNLNWNDESDQDMNAHKRDEIKLQNVRVTKQKKKKKKKPEPKHKAKQPEPKPKVPKETPRREVPDKTTQEIPEPTSEPEATPETKPMEKIQSSTLSKTSKPEPAPPAPEPKPPEPEPKPPKNKVFNKGTVDRNPQPRKAIKAEYPRRAKQANIEGRVIVQFVVDESGRPQDITVLRSPNDLLSKAAVEAVREATFRPGQQNGRPVKVRMSQPITFHLK